MKNLKNIKKVDYNKVNLEDKFSMCKKMHATRPKSSAFLTNLRIDMLVSKKLLFIFKNQWIKVKNFESCCHHPRKPAEANGTYLLSLSSFDDKFVISDSSGGGLLARGGQHV